MRENRKARDWTDAWPPRSVAFERVRLACSHLSGAALLVAACSGTQPSPAGPNLSGAADVAHEARATGLPPAAPASPRRTAGWPPYTHVASQEDTSADCPVPQLAPPAQLPRLAKLPDPFLRLDGTRVSQRAEWPCRRQEILRQAQTYVYGEKPPKPDHVGGAITSRELSVDVEHQGKRIHFNAEVVLPPTGEPPFPAIINLGLRSSFGGTRLGEDFVLGEGVALIYYNHNELGKEGKPEASRGLLNPGFFYDLYGGGHSAGLLMAWAWGASRLLDVLQQADGAIIDPSRVGVTGCSRNGKGAFTVGLFDERIALTIAHETSTAGVPAFRIVDALPGAERTNHNFYGLNWLSNDFLPFVEDATRLPIDTHELVAAIAPRGLLVLDNPHIPQFAAAAAHTAVLAGAEVYRAVGVGENLSYVSDVANEKHCAVGKPEYSEPLRRSIATFLKRSAPAISTIMAGAKGSGDLGPWRDWQAPALTSDRP